MESSQKRCLDDENSEDTKKRVNQDNTSELLRPVAPTERLSSNSQGTCELSILASSASTSTEMYRADDRLEYLKTAMPLNLMNSINTRDMNSVKLIIDDAFLTDCQLRTSAVPNEVTGCDKVYQFFQSYIQGCPDVIMTCVSPMRFNVRVISFLYTETGTRSNFNVPDELFDFLKHGTDRSSSFLIQKYKYNYLRNSNLNVPFTTTSYVNFILNKELTHVEKYIHACKEVVIAME